MAEAVLLLLAVRVWVVDGDRSVAPQPLLAGGGWRRAGLVRVLVPRVVVLAVVMRLAAVDAAAG